MTCSQSYEEDRTFHLDDYTVAYYRDYAKVFPEWKDPRINEKLPLCEYILATYNKEIAKKYNEKLSTQIPPKLLFKNFVRHQGTTGTGNCGLTIHNQILSHFVE
jgi:hypothetical protein